MASPNPSLETYRGIISGSVHDLSFEGDPSSPLLSLTQQLTERIQQSGGLSYEAGSWKWQDPSVDPTILRTTSSPLSSSCLHLTIPGSVRRVSETRRRLTFHLHSDQEQDAGAEHEWLVRLGEPRLLRSGLDCQPPLRVTLLGDAQSKQEGLVSPVNSLGDAEEEPEPKEEPMYIHQRRDGTYTLTTPHRLWGTATFVSKAGVEFASDLHLYGRIVLVPRGDDSPGLYEEIDRFLNDMPAISVAERGLSSLSSDCSVFIDDLDYGMPQAFSPSGMAAEREEQNNNPGPTDPWFKIEEGADPRELVLRSGSESDHQARGWADLPRAPTVEPLTPEATD